MALIQSHIGEAESYDAFQWNLQEEAQSVLDAQLIDNKRSIEIRSHPLSETSEELLEPWTFHQPVKPDAMESIPEEPGLASLVFMLAAHGSTMSSSAVLNAVPFYRSWTLKSARRLAQSHGCHHQLVLRGCSRHYGAGWGSKKRLE